jgi:hypothetical protein
MTTKSNKRLKANLKVRVFLIFLVLSVLFWTLIKLSKTYTTNVVFHTNYVNIPKNKVFQSSTVSEIAAAVKSSGFNLLSYKLKPRNLDIDLNNLSHKSGNLYYFLPNNYLADLRLQLNLESAIERVSLDTLFVSLGSNKLKKVPVELNAEIQFKLGFNFVEDLILNPDSVTVSGPASIIDTIYKIVTDRVELKEVSNNILHSVKLSNFKNDNITRSVEAITFKAEVDKFTENTLLVPFEVINISQDLKITTFPKEIKVIYKVGLTNFNKITSDNIKIVCDFEQSKKHNLNYLIPSLLEQSSFISSVRFVPNKIEFLIEK